MTKLYSDHDQHGEGANAPMTDVIQTYSLAELGRDRSRQFTESQQDASFRRKVNWWRVDSANALGNPIDGWVREYNHASGRVTCEFAQKWVDFQCLADDHEPAHSIFATSEVWADYASGADVPGAASLDRLSSLMQTVYRALFQKGDGSHAADELCTPGAGNPGQYPWLMQAASRLIVKHESEWANPEKWKRLIAELEKKTGPKPQHEEELKRIERLTWWDEVKAGVPGFPGPEVFHINPIGLVGNFAVECDCKERFEKISKIVLLNEGGFVNDASDSGGATNKGIAWATWQAYAQEDLCVEPTLENLKALTDDQARIIYLKRYWEPRGFCKINNEKTALNIYDWTITSGQAIRKIQEILISDYAKTIAHDNKMTDDLIDQINSIEDQEAFAQKIGAARKRYYSSLAYHPDGTPTRNHKFLKGWLSRVDRSLGYKGGTL